MTKAMNKFNLIEQDVTNLIDDALLDDAISVLTSFRDALDESCRETARVILYSNQSSPQMTIEHEQDCTYHKNTANGG